MQKYERHLPLRRIPGLAFTCAALLTVLLASGCQPRQNSADMDDWAYGGGSTSRYYSSGDSGQKDGDNLQIREQWEVRALELMLDTANVAKGTPYVFGGSSLSGFDCSGLVRWAYSALGVDLPRSAREQSQFGEKVDRDDLRMGDIVAFRHPRRGYHTGIYVGDGKFIHSPRRRDVVKVSSLTDAYFKDTYLGARRPSLPSDVDLKQVEESLASIKAQKKALQTAQNSQKIRNQTKPTTPPRAKSRQSAQSSKSSKEKEKAASSSKRSSSTKNKEKAATPNKEKAAAANKNKPASTGKTGEKAAASSKNKEKAAPASNKGKSSTASASKNKQSQAPARTKAAASGNSKQQTSKTSTQSTKNNKGR